jgi:hypothetical protein
MRGSGQDWLDGGLIGTMRRKDEMETLVTKKPPHEVSAQKPRKTSGNHKALITRNLRLAFGEVASEPVPDRFLDLLGRIDSAEGKKQ